MRIYVTNWSSKGTRGPGRAWTIMARPRTWERGEGAVPRLTPSHVMLTAVKKGEVSVASYRDDFLRHASVEELVARIGSSDVRVSDGDTLCCGCAKAAALNGECHRVWAAELLRRAGWQVILDGRELAGVDQDWRPVFE